MFLFCGYRDVFAVLVNRNHQPAGNFSYPYLCLSGLKKSWEFSVILMHSPRRVLSRLSKYSLSKWELEEKKTPLKKIFWLLFPDNDLCLPYPMDGRTVKCGAVSLRNWSNLKSELPWVLWHSVTALLKGSKSTRKLKHPKLLSSLSHFFRLRGYTVNNNQW